MHFIPVSLQPFVHFYELSVNFHALSLNAQLGLLLQLSVFVSSTFTDTAVERDMLWEVNSTYTCV